MNPPPRMRRWPTLRHEGDTARPQPGIMAATATADVPSSSFLFDAAERNDDPR